MEKHVTVSQNEQEFIVNALQEERRIDGRKLSDYRSLKISFGSRPGHVEVQLGETRSAFY